MPIYQVSLRRSPIHFPYAGRFVWKKTDKKEALASSVCGFFQRNKIFITLKLFDFYALWICKCRLKWLCVAYRNCAISCYFWRRERERDKPACIQDFDLSCESFTSNKIYNHSHIPSFLPYELRSMQLQTMNSHWEFRLGHCTHHKIHCEYIQCNGIPFAMANNGDFDGLNLIHDPIRIK